jgi:hypothetical protein
LKLLVAAAGKYRYAFLFLYLYAAARKILLTGAYRHVTSSHIEGAGSGVVRILIRTNHVNPAGSGYSNAINGKFYKFCALAAILRPAVL